jgi:epoxyqueuosine reductase QueG
MKRGAWAMNKTELTKELARMALEDGACLIGFSPVERYDGLPKKCGPRPQDIFPKAKSVICIAVQMPDACMERACYHDYSDPEGGFINVAVSLRLNLINARLTRLLEKNSFTAVPVAATVFWRYRSYKEYDAPFLSDLSHRHMAVGAGLGEFGWNGLLITKEFGPRVRLASIVTDAELEPSPMYDGPALCDKCMRCVRSCDKNIKGLTEGTKGKVQIEIGGKKCEYANKNLWYCAWTENFGIQYDAPKPPCMNEDKRGILL